MTPYNLPVVFISALLAFLFPCSAAQAGLSVEPPPGWTRAAHPAPQMLLTLKKSDASFSIQALPEEAPKNLSKKLAADRRRLGRKHKVSKASSGRTGSKEAYYFASFDARGTRTHFGYFAAGGECYSFLAKGASSADVRAVLSSTGPPPPAPGPGGLPRVSGRLPFLDGRILLPRTEGWNFEPTQAGDLAVSDEGWRFTLSASAVQTLTGTKAGDVKTLASAYLAVQETRLVDKEGCRASELKGDQLTNGWKLLYKWYECPRAAPGSRSAVGVLLLERAPVVAWFGDFAKAGDFDLFRAWLAEGRQPPAETGAAPAAPVRREPPAEKPANVFLVPVLAGTVVMVLVFVIGLMLRRRRA